MCYFYINSLKTLRVLSSIMVSSRIIFSNLKPLPIVNSKWGWLIKEVKVEIESILVKELVIFSIGETLIEFKLEND